VQNRNQN